MKKIVAASIVALSTSTAFGADLVSTQPHTQYATLPVPMFTESNAIDWTGLYVGGTVGASMRELKSGGWYGEDKDSAASGGIYAGYNFQYGNTVFGIEGDFIKNNIQNEIHGIIDSVAPQADTVAKIEGLSEIDYTATLRGRLGLLATDQTLLYGTAGVAYGRVSLEGNEVGTNGDVKISFDKAKDKFGAVVGGGIEHAFNDHISFRTEYMYTNLGDISGDIKGIEDIKNVKGIDDVVKNRYDFHTIRVGIAYKF